MNPISIVLVRPRDPNNIGACARAMGNFGLSDLRVVDPYEPVWRESVSAVGVNDIMQQAKRCATLDEALQDTAFSMASTAIKNREIKQEIVPLPSLNERLQVAPEGRVALVFGNEKSGLSGEDIERCDVVLNIPTASKQPSINLAQAVILTCYELSRRPGFKAIRRPGQAPEAPTDAQKEIFISSADVLFEKSGFKTDFSSDQRKALLRHMLSRQGLSREQLFFLKKWADKLSSKLP
ncbi:RNA methyltransferase [Candidatus Avelusimicrobium stercoris]|uniref:RNA methyltransferase n=1 Tax=Candidatus Avelusimicrobium stercoris TaxID=1947924 RepID=UPI003D0C4F26